MIPKVVASEIGTAQTLRLPYGLTARVIKGVEILDKFYAGTLRVTLKVLFEGIRSLARRVLAPKPLWRPPLGTRKAEGLQGFRTRPEKSIFRVTLGAPA